MNKIASAAADILRAFAKGPKKKYFTSAIIVAGGTGSRMGDTEKSKQLLEVDGVPVVVRSILAFEKCDMINEIVVAAREDELGLYAEFREKYKLTKLRTVTAGGSTRQDSVLAGFKKISEKSEFVAIHDAARCCITTQQIETVLHEGYFHGAATAAHRATDTVKLADSNGFIESTVDRDKVWLVSTPQVINTDIYRACAYSAKEKGISVTDDCGLLEVHGFKIKLCNIGKDNVKITEPGDLELAEMLVKRRKGKCE